MTTGALWPALSPVWDHRRTSLRRGLVKVPPQPGHHVTVFEHDGLHDGERCDLHAQSGENRVIIFRNGSPPNPASIEGSSP